MIDILIRDIFIKSKILFFWDIFIWVGRNILMGLVDRIIILRHVIK